MPPSHSTAAQPSADPADGAGTLEPPLVQHEVDGLVGYVEPGEASASGWRAVAEGGPPRAASLPMLDAVLDGFARRAAAALAASLGGRIVVSHRSTRTLRFAEYADGLPLPTEAYRFQAEGWGGAGLVTLGPGLAPIVLDRLLGGTLKPGPRPSVLRPATAIEAGILSRIVTVLLDEAATALSELEPVAFRLDGPVETLGECGVARALEEVLVVGFELDSDGHFAGFEIALPDSVLLGIRPLMAGRFTGEKLGRDALWAGHLATEMWQADVEAEAVLHETSLPLGRVLDLAVGETITFDLRPSDLVELRCGALLLTRGRMGRAGGRIAVQVTEPLRPAGAQAFGAAKRGRQA